jgi:intracellular multiplication protein IcmJ
MSKLSLRLGEGAWNLYAKRQTDPKFKEFSASIHKRDNNHCYFCGFSSNIHMMVVNLDHDYTNNKMSNLVTACPFCQQCLFLEACGKLQPGGGTMVYLPDISQEQLNASCHVLYASIVNGSTHARVADTYLQSLKLRAPYVEKAFGKNMSIPSFMGQMIIDTPGIDRQEVEQNMLQKVRVLPSLEKFEDAIVGWAKSAVS